MKIIDAYWEKENLGVISKEFILNEKDTVDDFLKSQLNTDEVEYFVVKVPVGRFDLNKILSDLGYSFIETSINLKLNLKNFIPQRLQERLNKDISYEKMNDSDLDQLFNEVKNGLFKTDRIILDNSFSIKQSSNRYQNWIRTELSKDAEIFKIVHKGDSIGFFILKQLNEFTYYPFLAGMYDSYINSGLGFVTLRKIIEEVESRGGKLIDTFVSSNNPNVIKTHLAMGFNLNTQNYVFVKHKK